jgi:hypothetical protein
LENRKRESQEVLLLLLLPMLLSIYWSLFSCGYLTISCSVYDDENLQAAAAAEAAHASKLQVLLLLLSLIVLTPLSSGRGCCSS